MAGAPGEVKGMKWSVGLWAGRRRCREANHRTFVRGGQAGGSGALVPMLLPAFLAVIALVSFPSVAGQATASFRISVTVVASCSVQTQPLVLAPYITGGAATGTASPGSIDVTCAQGTPAAVYLEGDRTVRSQSGVRMAYELRANGNLWPAGEAIHIKGLGPTAIHLAVSGSVPAGQKVPAGDYEDTAVVRVVY